MDFGDSNSHFFHNFLKERYFRNNILTLRSRDNVLLQEDDDIVLECIDFYSTLFDDSSSSFVDDPAVFYSIQFDITLSEEDMLNLSRPVTRDEVVISLSSIGSNKAPGPDGFSSWFFKFCRSILGDDFTAAVQNSLNMLRCSRR